MIRSALRKFSSKSAWPPVVHNLNPGPAKVCPEVLDKFYNEFYDYKGTGINIMEFSHRQKEFTDIADSLHVEFRKFMKVPDNFKLFFIQGGGISNFSSVPLNLGCHVFGDADASANYLISG